MRNIVEVHTLNAFTVPIFALKYNDCENLKNTVIPTFKSIEDSDSDKIYYENGYTNYTPGSNVLELNALEELKNFIEVSVNEVHRKLNLENQVYLINSWFSVNRKHSMHERHNHLPAVWSGVYYVQATNNDGNITFFNDHLKSNWPYCKTDINNPLTRQIFTIQPETGLLLIFPSFLEHQVHLNNTDNDRISLSFNFGN